MTAPRSNRLAVRNPIAGDPDVQAVISKLSPEAKAGLRDVLKVLANKWRAQARHSWDTHKAPIAAYHKANSVNARHLSLALREGPGGKS